MESFCSKQLNSGLILQQPIFIYPTAKMWRARLSGRMHEIRFNFCEFKTSSAGVRNFLNKNYLELKTLNPGLPIIMRDFKDIEPVVVARYDWGLEQERSLSNLKEEEIEEKIIELVEMSDPDHPEGAQNPYQKTWKRFLDDDIVDGIKGQETDIVNIKPWI